MEKRKLINYLGILGLISFLSYLAAVVFSPLAYPGYDWLSQAVSDLSADTAPSLGLWNQLSCLYGKCGIVSITCVCVFVSAHKIGPKLFRIGIYLFAIMNWVSAVGYDLFPLTNGGKEATSFQDIMHVYVVTISVVLLSIISLIMIIISGIKNKNVRSISIWAGICFAAMLFGAIGTNVFPAELFGLVERFSVLSATAFNAVLGIYLFKGFKK